MTLIILLIVFILFILCSALFSGAETALFSLSRARLLAWEKDSSPARRRAALLMKSYNRTLIAIVIGNMFVNIGLSISGNVIFSKLSLPLWLSTLLSILMVIVLLLMFGEVTPKTLALLYPELISEKVSGFIAFLRKVLAPMIFLMEKIFSFILDILGRRRSEPLHPEEYSSYLDMAYAIGAFSKDETKLFDNIFNLRKLTVGTVMKSRVDVKCVKFSTSPQKVTAMIQKCRELYIPVIKNDIDDTGSFLSVRDFYLTSYKDRKKWTENSTFRAVYIPENSTLTKALAELKKNSVPVALVVDEYGGVTGTIKMKDIFEELLGDITSEFEQPDWQIRKTGDNSWILSGQITLQDITEITGVKFRQTPLNTLNGLFYESTEKIPRKGSLLKLDGIKIKALNVKNNRIIEAEMKTVKKRGQTAE